MDNSKPGDHWSTKLGLLTGPVMILLGVIALRFSDKSPGMAYVIILFGLFRLGMSMYLYFSQKNNPNN